MYDLYPYKLFPSFLPVSHHYVHHAKICVLLVTHLYIDLASIIRQPISIDRTNGATNHLELC